MLWLIGNRTSCRPIWSVIILVIKQIGLPLRGRSILLIIHITYIPNFRPEALEPDAWTEHATDCYGTYTVVGVNIKWEMVLSPNDEEVTNSSEKHTQFKTRVHKPYPISDQNG